MRASLAKRDWWQIAKNWNNKTFSIHFLKQFFFFIEKIVPSMISTTFFHFLFSLQKKKMSNTNCFTHIYMPSPQLLFSEQLTPPIPFREQTKLLKAITSLSSFFKPYSNYLSVTCVFIFFQLFQLVSSQEMVVFSLSKRVEQAISVLLESVSLIFFTRK